MKIGGPGGEHRRHRRPSELQEINLHLLHIRLHLSTELMRGVRLVLLYVNDINGGGVILQEGLIVHIIYNQSHKHQFFSG